jgi:flagellin
LFPKSTRMRVNTNIGAIQAQRAMTTVNRESEESSAKLASGERITKAADDAAGLAISEKMKASIRSAKMANRNANDGISMVQVAEGGLNESTSILTRMRELAMQAATDSVADSERSMIQMEFQGMKMELERIAKVTVFNGKKLLDGSGSRMDFQIGVAGAGENDQISYNAGGFNATIGALGVGGVEVMSKQSAQQSLAVLDQAFDKIANQRSSLGSIQNRLLSSSNNLGHYTENMSASNSRIRDVDIASESSKQARNMTVMQAAVAVGAQANATPEAALRLL